MSEPTPMTFNVETEWSVKGVGEPTDPEDTDTVIASFPEQLMFGDALLAIQFGKWARQLAEASATNLGRKLYDAKFIITSDEEDVRNSMTHDCDVCRASNDKAIAALRANPKLRLAIGICRWLDDVNVSSVNNV